MDPIAIEGTLARILYTNADTAWSVVRLTIPGEDEITAVGNLLGVREGEQLRLSGRWIDDKKYGRQFQVEAYLTVKPSTLKGIERYLGSGMVEGIGPAMAKRLVDHFGRDTLDVIEQHHQRLTEVEGIGPVRAKRIKEAWAEQAEVKEVMIFLQSHGVSPAYAVRILAALRQARAGSGPRESVPPGPRGLRHRLREGGPGGPEPGLRDGLAGAGRGGDAARALRDCRGGTLVRAPQRADSAGPPRSCRSTRC